MKFNRLSTSQASEGKNSGRRSKTPVEQQARYIKRWKASQMNQADFCRQHQLHPKTFSRWLKISGTNRQDSSRTISGLSNKTQMQVDYLELKLSNGATFSFKGMLQGQWISAMIEEVCRCKFS